MNRVIRIGVVALAAVAAACSYQRAYLDYDDGAWKIPLRADAISGERLGVVHASEGGPLWRKCTDVASGSVWVMIADARAMGGNAIGDIKWFPAKRDFGHQAPVCKQKWGWFLIWPVLLTPGFQSAIVEATVYRVANPLAAPSGVFVIPERRDEQRALVDRIVRESAAPRTAGS